MVGGTGAGKDPGHRGRRGRGRVSGIGLPSPITRKRSWSSDDSWGEWSSKPKPNDPPHEGRAAEAKPWNAWPDDAKWNAWSHDHEAEWNAWPREEDEWNAWPRDEADQWNDGSSDAAAAPELKRYKSQLGGRPIVPD